MNYKKLDEDDILEILLEYFQDYLDNSEFARGILLGESDKDLRFIGIFGDQDENDIAMCDLVALDKRKEFNGDHQFLKDNPDLYL